MKKVTKIEVIKQLSKMRDFLYKNVGWDEWSKADKEVYQSILKYIDEEAEKNENL